MATSAGKAARVGHPGGCRLRVHVELPASVDVLWDFTTSPRKRLLWLQDFTAINQTNPSDRRGPGTTNHCVHGRAAITEEILDWHSFQYFTQRMDIPMMGPWVQTYEFSPVGSDVTELRIRIERLRGRRRLLLRVMQRRLAKGMRENTDRLAAVLREETSRSGRLPPLHDRHRLGGRFRRR